MCGRHKLNMWLWNGTCFNPLNRGDLNQILYRLNTMARGELRFNPLNRGDLNQIEEIIDSLPDEK